LLPYPFPPPPCQRHRAPAAALTDKAAVLSAGLPPEGSRVTVAAVFLLTRPGVRGGGGAAWLPGGEGHQDEPGCQRDHDDHRHDGQLSRRKCRIRIHNGLPLPGTMTLACTPGRQADAGLGDGGSCVSASSAARSAPEVASPER